jgi:hypothetical protein
MPVPPCQGLRLRPKYTASHGSGGIRKPRFGLDHGRNCLPVYSAEMPCTGIAGRHRATSRLYFESSWIRGQSVLQTKPVPFYNDGRFGIDMPPGGATLEERRMGHAVHIRSQDQYIQAVRVLDNVPGTWRGVGPSSAPVLLVTDMQYEALVEAGVVRANDKEVQPRGKKAAPKKARF